MRTTALPILGIVIGGGIVVLNRLYMGDASWWMRWTINAAGWLILASAVIPLCNRIRRAKESQ